MIDLNVKPTNSVFIEGLLEEVNLEKTNSFRNKATGGTQNGIRGEIRVRVEQALNEGDEPVVCTIPVSCFALEYKNNGEPNPAYARLESVMTDFTSLAAVGSQDEDGAQADYIRITGGRISENHYIDRSGNEKRYPRIEGAFFHHVTKPSPEARFANTIVVKGKAREIDASGEETGKYLINGAIINWDGTVGFVKFVTENARAIEYMEDNYEIDSTVHIEGKIMYSSKEVEVASEPTAFGEPTKRTRTTFVRDLVITSGSEPFDDDFAYDPSEIAKGIALANEKFKERQSNKGGTHMTAPSKEEKQDLGF